MVGAAKEVVIRNLASLREEGFIDTKGRQILILDKDALVRVSRVND
jgi:CRP-like cAMP-binding protein